MADDGGANIQTVFLEWATNFTVYPEDIHNVSVSVKKSARMARNYVTRFEVHLPERASVRIAVQNWIGKSAPSQMHVLPGNMTKQQSKANPFEATSVKIVVIISAVLIVFLCIIAFIVKYANLPF